MVDKNTKNQNLKIRSFKNVFLEIKIFFVLLSCTRLVYFWDYYENNLRIKTLRVLF